MTVEQDRFEKEVNFLDNNPEYSVVGSWVKIFPRNEIVKLPETPKLLDFLNECCVIHPTVMFRKSDFEKYNLKYDENFLVAQDYELWCRAVKKIKFYNIQEVLLNYRVEGQGNACKRRDERIKNTIRIQQNILDSLIGDRKLKETIIKKIFFRKKISKNFLEQIFSIKNSYIFNKQYKVITILGIEFKFLQKQY